MLTIKQLCQEGLVAKKQGVVVQPLTPAPGRQNRQNWEQPGLPRVPRLQRRHKETLSQKEQNKTTKQINQIMSMEQPTSQRSLAKPLNETTTMINNLQLHEKFTTISCWETPPEPNRHIPDPIPEKPKGEATPPEMLKTTTIGLYIQN